MEIKRVFIILIILYLLLWLNTGILRLERLQTHETLILDERQTSHQEPILPSITQLEGLPSNLVVAYDNSHTPGVTVINLEGNLTAAGSDFHTIDGVFSIPADAHVLLIPRTTVTYSTSELNIINNWFSGDGARLLWVAGDSDYGGYYNCTHSNEILARVGSNLRITAEAVADPVNNDGASYRVAVQTPISDGDLNSIFTRNVSSAIFHAPTPIVGYQSGAVVDLNQTSIDGVEIIMKSSIYSFALDQDFTGTEFDYYSSLNLNGSYPMMAIQDMGNGKSVIVSGETIFSDYQHMYDLYTSQGKLNNPSAWNGGYHEGKTLIDNILAWMGRRVGTEVKNIHMIFAEGGLGDLSFNDAAFHGYEQAAANFPDNFTFSYVEPEESDVISGYQMAAANSGEYDLIICIGFTQLDPLDASTEVYPDQKWTLIDQELDKPNVRSTTFKEQEGSFLVGAMAAMTTQTGKLGFLGGMDFDLINRFLAGYQAGAHYIHDGIGITAVYDRLPGPDCWNDIHGGKIAGKTLLKQGHDIIFTAAGETGQGTFQAVNEVEGVYAIGVDQDQDYLYPGKILCSMLKKIETAVYNSIRDIIFGNFSDGIQTLGLAENGVDISPMSHTQDIKYGNYVFNGITKTRWGWIEDFKGKIIDGSIIVPEEPDWGRVQRITYPTKETTITEWTTSTTTEQETTVTGGSRGLPEITPGFELSLLICIVSLAIFRIKKKK
ncbi:MAG: BMP family protein [Candidatus Thorarchaeota archaeon]